MGLAQQCCPSIGEGLDKRSANYWNRVAIKPSRAAKASWDACNIVYILHAIRQSAKKTGFACLNVNWYMLTKSADCIALKNIRWSLYIHGLH